MVAHVVDTRSSDKACNCLDTPECIRGRLRPDGEREAVERDGSHPGEPSQTTRAAILQVPVGDVLPDLDARQLLEQNGDQSRAERAPERRGRSSRDRDPQGLLRRRITRAAARPHGARISASDMRLDCSHVLGLGRLAIEQSRHLRQPGRLETGDERRRSGTAEAVTREAGWVDGPRSQGVMVGQELGEDPLPFGQISAVDPKLLEGLQSESAVTRHLLLGVGGAGPRAARRSAPLARKAEARRRVALEHPRADLP